MHPNNESALLPYRARKIVVTVDGVAVCKYHNTPLRTRKWRDRTTRVCQECSRESHRRYYQRNIDAVRANGRAQSRRKELLRKQQQVVIAGRPRPECCELCGYAGKIVFDHCHRSGKFRAWLCNRCNRVLGLIQDDIDILQKMIAYLSKHQ